MTRLFKIDNIGEWNGHEELVCDELNNKFFQNDEMLLGNEYQTADGTVYSWDEICGDYEEHLSDVLVDKINNHPCGLDNSNSTTFQESVNFTTNENEAPGRAVKIEVKRDINIYETLCKYCADNDIDLSPVANSDFEGASNIIETYGSADPQDFYFWID